MDRRSTVRINAERLRASLRAGSAEPQPAPAEAATEADLGMDRAVAGLFGVAERLKTFDLNVAIGAEAAKEVGAAMADMKIAEAAARMNLAESKQIHTRLPGKTLFINP